VEEQNSKNKKQSVRSIMKISIPVSVGELLDKISILEIKSLFTDNEYVQKELEELNIIKSTLTQYTLEYEVQLKKVNEKLWKIEDKLRKLEKEQRFDEEFIELARSVYITNDERARIKGEINQLTHSDFREIKIY
jgi:predicted  nucleic acid-binding Zn-ribbon protein